MNFSADLGLPKDQLNDILKAGNFGESFNFDYFTGVACLHLGGSVSSKNLKRDSISNHTPFF